MHVRTYQNVRLNVSAFEIFYDATKLIFRDAMRLIRDRCVLPGGGGGDVPQAPTSAGALGGRA